MCATAPAHTCTLRIWTLHSYGPEGVRGAAVPEYKGVPSNRTAGTGIFSAKTEFCTLNFIHLQGPCSFFMSSMQVLNRHYFPALSDIVSKDYRAISSSSSLRITRSLTAEPSCWISAVRSAGALFFSAFSETTGCPSSWQHCMPTSGEFSPIPPVNTTTSALPGNVRQAPSYLLMRQQNMSIASCALSFPASASPRISRMPEIPHTGRNAWPSAPYRTTETGFTCQIFSQYSSIARSEENFPILATLRMDIRVQRSTSR